MEDFLNKFLSKFTEFTESTMPLDHLTPKDIIGTSIIIGVCVLGIYAVYANYLKGDNKEKVGITPTEYRKFKLIEKKVVSHNTRRFKFALQSKDTVLGLPTGNHILFRYFDIDENGEKEEIRRPYTPVTSNRDLGYFETVIKIYPNGKMSNHLDNLRVGKDYIECRGPTGTIKYIKPGLFEIKQKKVLNKYPVKKIGMICGGTGITPMYQLIQQIISNPKDNTQVSMIFGNVSIDDILLFNELCEIRDKYSQIHISFIIDKAPSDGREWNEDVGYVTPDIIKKRLFPPSDDCIVLNCGPPIMVKICKKNLKSMNYPENRIIAY